jgi:hypothetical protein
LAVAAVWAEWQDKRHKLRSSLDLHDQKCESYIDDLDQALTIIAKLGILYETLSRSDQKELLRNVVERVVVNIEGEIERVDLLSPFAYLQEVSEKVRGGRSSSENPARIEKGDVAATCSSDVLECGHYKTQSEHSVSLNLKTLFLKFIAFPQFVNMERFSNRV